MHRTWQIEFRFFFVLEWCILRNPMGNFTFNPAFVFQTQLLEITAVIGSVMMVLNSPQKMSIRMDCQIRIPLKLMKEVKFIILFLSLLNKNLTLKCLVNLPCPFVDFWFFSNLWTLLALLAIRTLLAFFDFEKVLAGVNRVSPLFYCKLPNFSHFFL